MRVLHVIRSDGFAGVERHVATLAGGQAAFGHDVAVVGGDPRRMRGALAQTTVRLESAATLPETVGRVRRYARGAEVVHAHMTAAEFAASIASLGTPMVVTRHFARPRGSTAPGRLAGRFISRRIAAQIAISHYVAGAVGERSTVVHSGVPDQPRSSEARNSTILVAQRLQPEKETEVALRAFAHSLPPGWRLQIAGEGGEAERLRTLAIDLGVADSVDFLGQRADVNDLMRRAGVFLSPCRVEGLGMAVLEAMSHGLPVVASDSGAHPETVGLSSRSSLFAPGDWRQAGDLLSQLCLDEEKRVSYGAELQTIQRSTFSIDSQVAQTDRVYQEVLR
ncbi:glycosyltransferase family 4 protein [Ornithinimicrobium sp. CNJ-824]|uniref:glycosyltransferase family 4 protein n=1 Tax=Ornithinimicrobium sp. CNJ-824 TaxID=1904966 RepID=UPI00096AA729